MSTTEIKICGLTTADTLEAAIRARADYAGFVFFPPSPRYLTPREAAPLAERAHGRIARVGLFVDASDSAIAEAVSAARLDALQLHGDETPARAAHLRSQFGIPVWKAIPVAGPSDIERARVYEDAVDLLLFDAKTPKGTLPGGMGVVFDWTLIAGWKSRVRWGLAGGLDVANIAEAVRITGAPLVDASSGLERAPGVKDIDLIAAFCRAAREG
jgi:phosphoribosylanthranilate isomerase